MAGGFFLTKSIKIKFLAGIAAFTIIILASTGFVIYLRVSKTTEEMYLKNIDQQRVGLDIIINSFFANVAHVTTALDETDVVKMLGTNLTSYIHMNDPSGKNVMKPNNPYEEEIFKLCKLFFDNYPEVFTVGVASEIDGGFIMYPPSDRSNGYDPRTRSWYKSAFTNPGQAVFSSPYTTSAGELVISSVRTVNNQDNRVTGVMMVDVSLNYISEVLKSVKIGDNVFVMIIDDNDVILADPRDNSHIFKNIADVQIENFQEISIQAKNRFVPAQFADGKKYNIRIYPSQNEFVDMNYVISIPENEIRSKNNPIIIQILISIIVASLIGIAFAYILASLFSKPILTITKSLSSIEKGDLTTRVDIKNKDELGHLAGSFNETIGKVGTSIRAVIEESQSMKEIGEDLSREMNETAQAISEMGETIQNVKDQTINQSAGVEETRSTIEQIVRNIESLNRNIDLQTDSVMKSTASIEEMVAGIHSITSILGQNAESVSALGEAASKGQSKVNEASTISLKIKDESEGLLGASQMIQNIASQTNLLAMNAAIEAAHAGEAGRGFAVVAGEIRKLAEDSSAQGKNITLVLKGLKDSIEELARSTLEVQKQFGTIFSLTEQVKTQEQVITTAMQDQNTGGSQVLEGIQIIHEITKKVKNGSEEMLKGNREILVEMGKLADVTSSISSSMNELTSGTEHLGNSVDQVQESTRRNRDSIDRLSQGIRKFKV